MGNIVELIISLSALRAGYLEIVQSSLLGSILSNALCVLGMCFFFGGLKHSQQSFNKASSSTFSSLLLVSCLGLTLPSAFEHLLKPAPDAGRLLVLSRWIAVMMGVAYVLYLLFMLFTHSHIFSASDDDLSHEQLLVRNMASTRQVNAVADDDDEDDEPTLSLATTLVLLAIAATLVVLCSEFLVDSIEGVVEALGLSHAFIGVILLPIIGNAAEAAAAVTVAMRGKQGLAVSVAVGSSIQIALFVIPVSVVIGWLWGQPLSLDFQPFETTLLVLSVLVVNFLINQGKSNWLAGALLMISYFAIALTFFLLPDEISMNQGQNPA